MTLRHSKPKVRKPGQGFVLPDAPPRGPDDMTTFNHLTLTGNVHALALYLGSPETTTIGGELYIVREPRMPTLGRRIPDLLIAFDTDPELYWETNGYVISDQGKPPDFVMEVGSRTTDHIDVGAKRVDYASLNGYRSTGASTRRGATTKARRWPETGSSAVSTSRLS